MSLTKTELATMLFEQLGVTEREAKVVVESFYEEIRLALEAGESVNLAGFGGFMRGLRGLPPQHETQSADSAIKLIAAFRGEHCASHCFGSRERLRVFR